MAPRAYWKGFLKLSLVSCPISLFPATSEREKISFHQLNKETGHRIRYRKIDADTGDEVEQSNIIKGYEVGKGEYIELDPDELEAVAIESKRTIEIEEFVPKSEIDEIYMRDPYYIIPDGEVGQQAFAVIREAIRKEGMVALGKVVFTSREHIISLEARDKGMMGITLRYPYEVRDQNEYFDEIENEKVPKDMLDLAIHIVETKKGTFEPEKFEDQYEDALKELIRKKQKGEKIERPKEPQRSNVVNLMDALKKSVAADKGTRPQVKKARSGSKDSAKCCYRSPARRARTSQSPVRERRPGKGRPANSKQWKASNAARCNHVNFRALHAMPPSQHDRRCRAQALRPKTGCADRQLHQATSLHQMRQRQRHGRKSARN
jgi:DNA end-binding protein Ku